MAEEFRPVKRPGELQEADTDDTVLCQGVKANAGELEFEDGVTGVKTLAQLAAGGGGGEANDIANAGTGVSLVASPSKVGLNVQTASISAASARVTIGTDVPNNDRPIDVVEANIVHQNISGAGTNDHAAIDSHIASTANPHSVTASQAGAIEELSSAATDDEVILGNGTVSGLKRGSVLWKEVGGTGVVGDPSSIVEDDGGGNVRINAHTHVFKTTVSLTGIVARVDVPLISAIAIPLNSTRFVGVDYNGGTPIAIVTTDPTQFDLVTKMPLAFVSRDATGVYPIPWAIPLTVFPARAHQREFDTEPVKYSEGLIIDTSGAGDDKVSMTAGSVYVVYLEQTFAAIDTNVSGSFDVYTGSTGGGFSFQTPLTDYPQNQYNDLTNSPATLTSNRYGNIWWYLDVSSGSIVGFLGTSNSTSFSGAHAEAVPVDLPPRLSTSILIGRFVILRDTPASTVVESSFRTSFQGQEVTDHAQLSGLTTGDAGHTQLQTRSEKGAPSGYASLDADVMLVEPAQVIHETGGPTDLTVGAVADGQFLQRVGSTLVGAAGGGGGTLNLGFRTRTTTAFNINTTASFIDFDQEDNGIASFFTYSSGTYTAQKSFSAFIYTEATMSWNSGTEPKCWVDIVKNAGTGNILLGTKSANVYSSLMQQNGLSCIGFGSFVATDTLRIYWYTTSGDVNLLAETPKVAILPLEVS